MSQIVHVPERRLWVLTAAASSYVLHLGYEDVLCAVHWGCALDAGQAVSLLDYPTPRARSFEDPRDGMLDLSATGGLRYGRSGIQVLFADGTRDLELAFTGQRIVETGDGSELTLCFADRHHPLAVEAHYRVHDASAAIERSLTLIHTGGPGGSTPFTVVRADAATWVLPRLDDYRLSQVRGQWSAENGLNRSILPYGETLLTSRRGVTGHAANPWVMIDDGAATEIHGAVYSAALAWSGSWQVTVQRLPSEQVAVFAGAGHEPTVRELSPGEQLRTPVSVGIYTDAGFGGAGRAWHEYIRTRVLPHPDELRPVLYNSWEAAGFDLSLDGQMALADRAAATGVELFVMDDGWFGARTHDAAGLGDWIANPERFPDGLGPLAQHVHDLGMQFGLWVEPEMVNPDSDLYRAHPDWVVHREYRRRTESRNQLVLNLALPEVAEWVHDTISGLLLATPIDFLKWDMNRPLTEVGPLAAGPHDDRLWSDYVENLYTILDRLRMNHPRLRIESCASGGGRLDLGILARTDQVWASDNTDAADRLHIQHGYSQVYPAQTMGAWVTDSPNPFTGRHIPLAFRFHVASAGVLGIGGDLAAWDEEELAQAAQHVTQYKSVRPLIQHGQLYRLGAPDRGLHALQFLGPDGAQTAVLAFFEARRFGGADPGLPLRGLDPQARYRDAATGRIHHGAVLRSRGLPLDLPAGDYASTLIHLRRVGNPADPSENGVIQAL